MRGVEGIISINAFATCQPKLELIIRFVIFNKKINTNIKNVKFEGLFLMYKLILQDNMQYICSETMLYINMKSSTFFLWMFIDC